MEADLSIINCRIVGPEEIIEAGLVIHLKKRKKVSARIHHRISDFCIHDGWDLEGWPVLTVALGEVVMENREPLGTPGRGRYIPGSLEKSSLEKGEEKPRADIGAYLRG